MAGIANPSSAPVFDQNHTQDDSVSVAVSRRRSRAGNGNTDEFFGEQVVCPTCRGAGLIARETDQEMMALIPLSDKRLRPRRTALYVTLAVVVCLITGGLLLFFLFPRSVELTSTQPSLMPTNVYTNVTKGILFMTVTNYFNITNYNFYSVDVAALDVTMYYDRQIEASDTNKTRLTLPIRSTRLHYMTMNVTFRAEQSYLVPACKTVPGMMLLIPFRATATLEYMGKSEQNSLQTYQYVHCNTKIIS